MRNRQHLRKFTPFYKSPDTVVKELTAPLPYSSPAESVNNSSKPCTSTPPTVQPDPAESINNSSKPCISTPPTVQPHPADHEYHDTLDAPTQTPPVEETDDTRPAAQKLPRAVGRLLPHNIPGQSEQQPLGPRRCKQANTNSC